MENSNVNQNKCPFKKLNNRLHTSTKNNIVSVFKSHQISKHREYVDILKESFQVNENYFINIQDHIDIEDVEIFIKQSEVKISIDFLNNKIKEYFWKGIILHKKEELTFRQSALQKIGNLGIDDVTSILEKLIFHENISLEEILIQLDEEITLRLQNNVLIDSILHLDNFKHTLITKNSEQHANSILGILKENFNTITKRFSPILVADEFSEAMRKDHMIDDKGFIPQLTFGCPIVNINSGKVFRAFVIQFIKYFLTKIMKN